MKQFKDFGIKPNNNGLLGDKIKITRILNRNIKVCDYRIEPSKFKDKGTGKCLYLQVEIDGQLHVVFTGSSVLMDMISQVPKTGFPFQTTITQNNDRFEFN